MRTENARDIIDLLGLNPDKAMLKLLSKFSLRKNGRGYILVAPNEQFKKWAEEFVLKRCKNKTAISEIVVKNGNSNGNGSEASSLKSDFEQQCEAPLLENGLCRRLTFDNYIVGDSNRTVYEIALSVACEHTNIYNPLIIYGRVGVGKTHILHAIGNKRMEIGYRVVYKSINDFSEEVVRYITKGQISLWREKYKSVDVLLIDDIQFLAGKERTQIELFNIFNYLLMMGKQIVLTSDRHPKDLVDVSDRLINRFSAGLIMELDIDRETKVTIIEKKLEEYGIPYDERIVNYIVDNTGNNVREVEGAIRKIKALGIERVLMEAEESEREGISFDYIRKVVANYYGLNSEDLIKGSRKKRIAEARHVCMYLSKKLLEGASLVQIARAYGVKDHTTVIHALNKIEEKKRKDRRFGYFLSTIEKHIKQKA